MKADLVRHNHLTARLPMSRWLGALLVVATLLSLGCGSEDDDSRERPAEFGGSEEAEPQATETNFQPAPCINGECPEGFECVSSSLGESVGGADAGADGICMLAGG